jgi:hypothetical protein
MPLEQTQPSSEPQEPPPSGNQSLDFRSELKALINRHSRENSSNTPDFILAQFLALSLDNFDRAVKDRDRWYGIAHKAGDASMIPSPPRACFTKMAPHPGYKFVVRAGLVHHIPEDADDPLPLPLEDHMP